jgi:hypothetical protein
LATTQTPDTNAITAAIERVLAATLPDTIPAERRAQIADRARRRIADVWLNGKMDTLEFFDILDM